MEGRSIKIRQIILGDGVPKICVPVMAANRNEIDMQMEVVLKSPCDVIEWRADAFKDWAAENWVTDNLTYIRKLAGERTILFTFRTREEGGERSISKEEYRRINLQASASKMADLIDLEWNRGDHFIQEIVKKVQENGTKVVGSFHDFEKTPSKEELLNIISGMQKIGTDITKVAVMPRSERDVLTLLDLSVTLKEGFADRPYITMSMSRTGAVSRLCGALTGSAITFATAGKASAPGQMEAGFVKGVLEVL